MSTPEQHRPPIYACAAGAVLHAHSADTLEPAVVLYTFLPSGASERLDALEAKVDVHGDGPGSSTLTVRVLSDGQSLSWQLPIAPFVAALPGQPGDEGRMVLLAVMDAEPEEGFWAQPVDCERLAAELQLPVTDLVDALRGRLTPWLADDVELLLHDDAHEHAADLSPAETLASAVVAHYKGDLEAEQASARLLRAFEYAPKDFQAELGTRLCGALATAVVVAGPEAVDTVLEQTGPFEPEVSRLLTELRGAVGQLDDFDPDAATEAAAGVVLSGNETAEAIKGAVAAIARLARIAFGQDAPTEDLLRRLAMTSDAAQYRLAGLWVDLAVAAGGSADIDPVVASELASRVQEEGAVGAQFLRGTAAVLGSYALELAGKPGGRMAVPLKGIDQLLNARQPAGASLPVELANEGIRHCLSLARFIRSRGGIGPGAWRQVPVESAAQAVGHAVAKGLETELAVDLLDNLLADDVQGPDLLEVFVCAVAQLLVEVDPLDPPEVQQSRVDELIAAVKGSWLMTACLQEAPDHDPAATDVRDYLPRASRMRAEEADRLALKAGRRGVMASGLACIDAFATVVGSGL
ncbi:MAG: hypothetical protein JWM40_1992, partial [Frankiales bacterium]|nr:hypothetical protein [Frankiales bacterium]